MSNIDAPQGLATVAGSTRGRRRLRSRLLLTACFLAAPGFAYAQDSNVGAGETRTNSLSMDAADTLTVEAGGTFRVAGNQAISINGGSTGDGIVITNDGTIEAVPTSDSNGRAITGSTPADDRTLTIINRGDILSANDTIRIADSSSNPSGGGVVTIDNAGRIISSGLSNTGVVSQSAQAIEMGVGAGTLNVTNREGGVIEGTAHGIQTAAGANVVVNSGRIAAVGTPSAQGEGIRTNLTSSNPGLNPTLDLTNEASGVIVGGYGVTGLGSTTIVNRGTIMGDSDSAVSHARTAIRILNNFEGQANSVTLAAGSTTAAGTGPGATDQAVSFGGSKSGTNRLTIETGATIVGSLRGATSDVIEDTLVLTGSGEQILGSAEDFDRLEVDGGTWGITNSITARNGAEIAAGATLRFDDSADSGGLVRGGAIVNNGTLVINRSESTSQAYDADGDGGADPIHAAISGAGSLRLTGTGTFALTTANSYTGDTVISAGRLRTDGENVLSAASAVSVTGDGVLDLNDGTTDADGAATPVAHSQTIANLSGDGSVRTGSLNGATLMTGSAGEDAVFAGVISELGGVTKVGTGTLTLSGANSATGMLRVANGTVALSGSWAGGATVESGASLAGGGTISGVLTVGEGAIAPGNGGMGVLTTGGLTLSEGSVLSYDLGAPGSGDRIQVNGDLMLDGTLDITDVGGFGEGVYRLIDYSGSLTDNGLLVGTVPSGEDAGIMAVQTTIASQINLVYGTPNPAAILFWDGVDITSNNVVDGGSGSWTSSQPNWTDANGATNMGWGGLFAVFQGAAGTVAVDDAIDFTGAQFMTDGYVMAAGSGSLSAVDPQTNIRVDPGVTATISADIGGSGGILKNDAGTLILSGANSYAGATSVEGGTVQLVGGAAIPVTSEVTVGTNGTLDVRGNQAIGNLAGMGTVLLSGADLTTGGLGGATTFDGSISGSGALVKTGAGSFTLGGANDYAGVTEVAGGTLVLDGSVAGEVHVAEGATLGGSGSAAGAVTLADGARLSAGGPGAATFTAGGLTLSEGSALDFSLGAPNVAGASDRIQVNGDLTLDGRLDVTDVGGFGIGVYRLIDYSGGLTDNGLDLGTFPDGTVLSSVEVQTSVASQVNLVVESDKPEIQFWDGAGTSSNGAIEGGSGSWTNARTSWTGADGTANAGWGSRFAVFQGEAGTVTVDDSIAFSGMQFMTDGYVIAGGSGSLNAVEAATNIRVDPNVTATIAASIGGTGGITKLDSGTLILDGVNDYAGTTLVAGGTLRAGATGALPGGTAVTVAEGATLDVAASQTIGSLTGAGSVTLSGGNLSTGAAGVDTRFEGIISGSGGLTKTGSGVFILAGTNSYAGDTTVAAGTLRLDGGAIGAGDLSVADGATFDLNGAGVAVSSLGGAGDILLGSGTLTAGGAADSEFSGTIGGTGSLVKAGEGDLTLSGANSYSGGTTVRGGTLTAGHTGALGSGAMTVEEAGSVSLGSFSQTLASLAGDGGVDLGSATLTLNGSGATLYGGILSGTGGVTLNGGGTLTLAGDNSYTGSTTITNGRLIVDGSLASAITIGAAGRLGGSGRIGALTVGGTIAPGNSIGTLNVNGALTFASGSTYEVEIAPDGTSDRIDASGAVTIQGGTVAVLAGGATNFANVTNYTILTGSSVTGNFTDVTSDLAFFTPSLVYGTSAVRLRLLRNDVALVDIAETPNQLAVATALDAAASGELFDTVLNLSTEGAREAYDDLAGEIHVAGSALASRDAHGAARALLDRLAAGGGDGLQIWIEGDTGDMHAKARSGLARVETDRTAFAGGVELGSERTRGGIAYQRATSDFDVAARSSAGDLKSDSVYAYIRHDAGDLRIAGGAGLSTHAVSVNRDVAIGSLSNALHGREKSVSYVGFAELSYRARLGGTALEPYAGLSIAETHFDGVREGGGAAALWVRKVKETTTLAGYGIRVSAPFGGLTLSADVGGRSYLGGDIDSRLISLPDSDPFVIEGARFGRHSLAGRLDATYATGSAVFGVGARGETSKQGSGYSLRATIGYRF